MKSIKRKLLIMAGGAALTIVGFLIVPPIINKVSRKVYRAANKVDDINLDELGPEIVRTSDLEDGEE